MANGGQKKLVCKTRLASCGPLFGRDRSLYQNPLEPAGFDLFAHIAVDLVEDQRHREKTLGLRKANIAENAVRRPCQVEDPPLRQGIVNIENAHRMIVGYGFKHPQGFAWAEHVPDLLDIGDYIRMGLNNPLRQPGRARGIENLRFIPRQNLDFGRWPFFHKQCIPWQRIISDALSQYDSQRLTQPSANLPELLIPLAVDNQHFNARMLDTVGEHLVW